MKSPDTSEWFEENPVALECFYRDDDGHLRFKGIVNRAWKPKRGKGVVLIEYTKERASIARLVMKDASLLAPIAEAADALEDYLAKNSGTTDEWPIDIKVRGGNGDEEVANTVTRLLQNLATALKPFRKGKK